MGIGIKTYRSGGGGIALLEKLTADATATSANIEDGYTAWVKGKKVTGTGKMKTTPTLVDNMTAWSTNSSTWTKTITGDFIFAVFNTEAGALHHFGYCINGTLKVLNATSSTLTITYSGNTLTLKSVYGGYDMKICIMSL